MEKWLFVVRTNCRDDSRESNDEFNEWYNNIHVPDVLTVPGVLTGDRFLNPEWSSHEGGSYLALYEVETDDIEKTKALLAENLEKWYKKGRISDKIVIVNLGFYKPIYSFSK